MRHFILTIYLLIGFSNFATSQGNTPFYHELARLLRLNEPLCLDKPIEVLNLNDSVLTIIYVDPNPGKLNEAIQLLDSITKYHFKDKGIIQDLTNILKLYDYRHLAQYAIDLSAGMYERSIFSYQMSRFNDGIQRQSRHFEAKPQEIDVIYHLEASICIISELGQGSMDVLKYVLNFQRDRPKVTDAISNTAHQSLMMYGRIKHYVSENIEMFKEDLMTYAKSSVLNELDAGRIMMAIVGHPLIEGRCDLLKEAMANDNQHLIKKALITRNKNFTWSPCCPELLDE